MTDRTEAETGPEDIVPRLRHLSKILGVGSFDIPARLNEAADEIERLRGYAQSPDQTPVTLWGQIAAIYGRLDAEDCAWIDREWAKMRGMGWQPIETAPKDGTYVLVFVESSGGLGEAYFDIQDDNWWWANTAPHDFDPTYATDPTHWMPLPQGPDTSTDRASAATVSDLAKCVRDGMHDSEGKFANQPYSEVVAAMILQKFDVRTKDASSDTSPDRSKDQTHG